MLRDDYVSQVTYGLKRNGSWVEAVRYRSIGGTLVTDDDPGKLRPGADISNTSFSSFLSYNDNWRKLSSSERQKVEGLLPFQRNTCEEPGIESGYWLDDKNYSAGGRGLARSTIKRF